MPRISLIEVPRREQRRMGISSRTRLTRLERRLSFRKRTETTIKVDTALEALRTALQEVVGQIAAAEPELQRMIKERDSLLRKIRKHQKARGK